MLSKLMKPRENEEQCTSLVVFEKGLKNTLRSECFLAGTICAGNKKDETLEENLYKIYEPNY